MSITPNEPLAAGAPPPVSRFSVELIIREIQVTATNRFIAGNYAAADAREFLANWNYTVGTVGPAAAGGLALTVDLTDEMPPIAVNVKDSVRDVGRERLYSCDASFIVGVDARDCYSAGETALRLVTEPCRISAQLAAYRDQAFWDKLLPVAAPSFDQMAEVLRRRGFDATVRSSSVSDADRFLAIDVATEGERVGTLSLVKHMASPADAERPAMSPCLHFAGEHDVEASSIPCDHPDVWFNDAQLVAGDIACLDVDAFDAFFDAVLDQRDDTCAPAAPTTAA